MGKIWVQPFPQKFRGWLVLVSINKTFTQKLDILRIKKSGVILNVFKKTINGPCIISITYSDVTVQRFSLPPTLSQI